MAGPLDGYTVLDLSQLVSGPFATMLLADQGAEVIKVEPVLGPGDVTRIPTYAKGGVAAIFANTNRGKRGMTIDLSVEAGVDLLLDLAAEVDVVVQNFRPGAVDRMGVGYEAVRARNPDVIYCSVSGYGPTGPYADQRVVDPIIQGMTGVVSRQVNPQIPFPDLIRNLYADKTTAFTAAQAITAALLARERGRGGQHVELSMLDSCLYFYWPDAMMDMTLLDDDVSPGRALSDVYQLTPTADGQIIYFVTNDPQRHALFTALGHPEWADDPRFATIAAQESGDNAEALGTMIAAAFLELTTEAAFDRLRAHDVPCGPILTAEQVVVDPQIVHNETLIEWDHPDAGRVRQPRPAARFSSTAIDVPTSVPQRGQHNDEVLEQFGHTAEQVAALRQAGVIGEALP